MHLHLIDWLRRVHIQSDTTLAKKRWDAAEKISQKLTREATGKVLGLFLFPTPDSENVTWLTNKFLTHDAEFPIASNTEEIRLMAGVIMITTFTPGSKEGIAFALGLRAASYPASRIFPAEPSILAEANNYLLAESERQRPSNFGVETENPQKAIAASYKAMREQEAAESDAAKIQNAQSNYHKILAQSITGNYRELAKQIRRLAEESGMLWWVIGEYSDSLASNTSSLQGVGYALVAAGEAADRTQILPPPSSAAALLSRALKVCKAATKKALLADYLSVTSKEWRLDVAKRSDLADVASLVPISVALSRCNESGDPVSAIKIVSNVCPGIEENLSLTPREAAQQFYAELMFLRSLDAFA